MQSVQLSAQKSFSVVQVIIELDSYSHIFVVGDQYLVMHGQKRQLNVYGYDPKVGSKHFCIVDAAVAYDEPETSHFVISLICWTI